MPRSYPGWLSLGCIAILSTQCCRPSSFHHVNGCAGTMSCYVNMQGEWKQRTIPNPEYFKVEAPLDLLAPIVAVGFELWTTDTGYTFDSVMIGKGQEGLDAAAAYIRKVWKPRHQAEVSIGSKQMHHYCW
eukprot:GHRR01035041.1.p1 GENE.GHRR01035041.1~~GHRR01035041.1.p1  ORF type:complete len:130 (-),score=21.97 GHRR01035041.1:237-626(-)